LASVKPYAPLLCLLALGGCTKDSGPARDQEPARGSAAIAPVKPPPPPPPPPPPRDGRAHIPANPPPVGSVAFVCNHSDEPFGNGSFMTMTVYDLDRGTWTLDSATTPSTKERRVPTAPGDPSDTVTKHAMGKIAPAKLEPLRAAAAKVLTGGPYEPEFPVPEGISCHVTLADAKGNAFFEIEKAHNDKKDAVNDLLTALFASSEQTGGSAR